ncbi:MAG: helix-turn-helix protein [Bradyrhizobium sp.]|jgi:AraC family transcriptional regulator of adaptative response / DNA-3-methyladenine glycosylase II|nr:helix-turn-helix protein [Bradyrhizobium sp.]MEA2867069.1 AraC family transcriptional regulator [Bradyrhizobium sp.]
MDDASIMDMDRTACYRAISTRDARFDGRLFVGVKTTGIYCRPICPARTPKFANVSFYPSAAAAQEAGFRPCLRCRPETSPDLAFWRGTSNTVSRALALIETGGLDEADVEGLANRLGVGARQLRRLFRQHVGASPIAVAQTRRVLLAKQLIHETTLPMAEVALAAGFNSIRRFNETFLQLFGRSPAKLRRIHDKTKREAGALSVRLAYRPPYDWEAMLSFLAARAIPGVEIVSENTYRRTIAIGDDFGVISVAPADKNRVNVSVRSPNMAALPQVIARVRRVFDLAADPDMIGAHLSLDPVLAPLVSARPGLRVPGAWDGFELAVRAVFGQQITVSAATKLLGKLVLAHGARLPAAAKDVEGLSHLFPSPTRIARADLALLGMPGARAMAVTSLAAAISADPTIFNRGASLEEAIATLRSLPGIGEWTAQYIAMRELREPDAFPAADIGLLRAMATADGRRPSPTELLSRAERWRPWRAYAALHLWAAGIQQPISSRKTHEREAA